MKKYPKTEKYDNKWIKENWMGPNPLILLEELCEHLDLKPGMKVLDMGCGKGITSIFLAKEYGVTVFANDLWIDATENLQRFEQAGVADKVYPIHAEAHALPYAKGFFDVVIAVDCYHYFGAGENYFVDVFSKLVKPGGQLGIVVPGLRKEFEKGYPDTLEKLWIPEYYPFHSDKWWRTLWEKTGLCKITASYPMEDSRALWLDWADWSIENFTRVFGIEEGADADMELLQADTNDDLALVVMAAVKKY